MSNSPFPDGELATLHLAELRREAAAHRLAREVRRARRLARREDRDRRLGRVRTLFRTSRDPQAASQVVAPGGPA